MAKPKKIDIGPELPAIDDAEAENQETPEAIPQLTRVQRVSGHELADTLRHERRLKRLAEKGY